MAKSQKLKAVFAVLQEQFDIKQVMLELTCLNHHVQRILDRLQMDQGESENIDILF